MLQRENDLDLSLKQITMFFKKKITSSFAIKENQYIFALPN